MVKQYLEKNMQELLSRRIDIEKQLQKNDLLIRENLEFVRMIQDSEDKIYDAFSPQQYKTNINQEKIDSLKQQKKELEENHTKIKEKLEKTNQEIDELNQIIAQAKQDTLKLEKEQADKEQIEFNFNTMIRKIELCQSLVGVDDSRCKIELQALLKSIENVKNEIKNVFL